MRNTTACTVAIVASLAFSAAQAAELTIEVTAIKDIKGTIMLAMYDNAAGFDEGAGPPVHASGIAVESDTVTLTLPDLPAGQYAIKLYHDANGNGEMDSNMLGLPLEGYGFSGNGGRFGPPSFEEAAFTVVEDEDQTVSITLR